MPEAKDINLNDNIGVGDGEKTPDSSPSKVSKQKGSKGNKNYALKLKLFFYYHLSNIKKRW